MELTFLFDIPSTENYTPTLKEKLRIYSAEPNGASSTARCYYAMIGGYTPFAQYWTDTKIDAYFGEGFTLKQDGIITLPAGVDIGYEAKEGYFTFGSASPYAGERCEWNGYDVIDLMTTATQEREIKLYKNKVYCVQAKTEALLNKPLTIKYDYTEISEPINFDSFETKITRSDFHGMSVENSLDKLEFYGVAYDIIAKAYDTDIDTGLRLHVFADGKTIYEGVVDLSTCEFKNSNYQSVSATLAEIGDKTTFNNRVKTEVDINGAMTIDGIDIEPAHFSEVDVPSKSLQYTNVTRQLEDVEIVSGGGYQPYHDTGIYIGKRYPFIMIPIGEITINEFGSITDVAAYTADSEENLTVQYTPNDSHTGDFGANTTASVSIKLNASITRQDTGWATDTETLKSQHIYWRLVASSTNKTIYGVQHSATLYDIGHKGDTLDISCDLAEEMPADKSIKYYVLFDIELGESSDLYLYVHISVKRGSYFKMIMYDNLPKESTPVEMITVHDALNVIARTISESSITVKSDWYGQPTSQFNPTTEIGNGAQRSLTNGYKIRDLFTDEENERNMSISFSDMIDSLQAIDCIGWGFSEEDGKTYVRIEPWSWFYKDTIILSLADVSEMIRTTDADTIYTKFTIGYNKYENNDTYNSIDSIHGERVFVSKIKAVSNEIEAICDFIADNYAIELTRRARADSKASEEFSYDENIFIFELSNGKVRFPLYLATFMERKEEQMNVGISPRRCAKRWESYLFRANSDSNLAFKSGTINYKPSLTFTEYGDTTRTTLAEDADIPYTKSILKAETVEFTYPLSVDEYKKVKANPYGLIEVDGILGWIKEFAYSFSDGEATFKLIPKAD